MRLLDIVMMNSTTVNSYMTELVGQAWIPKRRKNKKERKCSFNLYLKYWVIVYTCQVKAEKQKEEKHSWQKWS